MTVAINEKELKELQKESDEPKRAVSLSVDRNRWFFFSIALLLVIVFMGIITLNATNKAANNQELLYVKLQPDGTWDVGKYEPQDKQLFYKSTINSLLEKYLIVRFGVQPETVKRDYGEAATFMAPALYQSFVGSQEGDFNAVQKAADIQANTDKARRELVEWKFVDHYDQVSAVFGTEEGTAIRSNIYFKKTTKTASGMTIGEPEHLIARLQWRLLPKSELAKKSEAWLRANPIGLQVISQDIIEDPAASGAEQE